MSLALTHQSKSVMVTSETVRGTRRASFKPNFSAAFLQRKADCACGGGCPRCASELPVQTKLSVSQPGDVYEQEADRVADQVMRMAEPTVQRACAPCAAGGSPCPKCEEESGIVQRKVGDSGHHVSSTDNVLNGLGSGQPLDLPTRSFMEPRFGFDFSHVRVHTDTSANESAKSLNAMAYTTGRDIVFAQRQYDPASSEGRRLLAHELTHVVQQSASAQAKISASPRMLQRQTQGSSPPPAPGPAQSAGQTPQPTPPPAAPAPPTRASLIKDKKLDTNENVDDLAGILYHETRGGHGIPMNVAIGWIVLNRMLILNRTRVGTLIGGNQLAKLAGAPFDLKLLAYMLLSGHYEDPTNGSFFYVTPKIMPDFPNRACCTGQTGTCNTLRFEQGVDCQGGLQAVPGADPPQQRFFPSFARAGKRQPQPEGTDPMLIQVYQQ